MLQAIFLQVTRSSYAKSFKLSGISAFCFLALIASCCNAQSPVSVPSDARLVNVGEVQMAEEMDFCCASNSGELTSFSGEESSGNAVVVVKNQNLFGDRKRCCDEWAGFCRIKELSYGCNCGGLKSNPGHLGISWLRSRDAGEDCDYCNGGCCEKGESCFKRNAKKRCSVFTDAFKKCSRSKCGCEEETCSEEEGCASCQK